MHRRRYLALVGAAGATGLAGCAGYRGPTSGGSPSRSPSPTTVQVGDVTLPVPGSEMVTAIHRDGIPAITDPAFGEDWSDWSAVPVEHRPPPAERPALPDAFPVVGVERDGEARAYPLAVLDWHEVVNEEFGGPLLVTYCPLCGSGVVAERFADGEPTAFGVSGKLWRNDLVLYDRATESLWSQLLATAIQGPKTGTELRLLSSTLASWGEWRTAHPETRVLLPPPGSVAIGGRRKQVPDYGDSKYGYESQRQLVGFDREAAGLTERTLVAYDRRVGGGTLRFESGDERHLLAGGSRWERTTGRAVDGPHEGRRLDRTDERTAMFWSAWFAFHPDTEVYGR